jgi:hypothetical protein
MSDPETSFDDGIVADMRAHGGKVDRPARRPSHPHHDVDGARSGQARRRC